MSHSSGITVTEELCTEFEKANNSGSNVRYFQVKIEGEHMQISHQQQSTGSVASDYNSMRDHVAPKEASYFLFRTENKNWLIITFVPDGVAIKDKMVYASTKGTLKSKLGFNYFLDEVHVTSLEELDYEYYKGSKKKIDARSDFEITREKIHKMEDEERSDRAIHAPSTGGGSGIGGYHSVTIPFTENAKNQIRSFKTGDVNFLEFTISDSKDSIDVTESEKLNDVASLSRKIHKSEPRFYLYLYNRMTTTYGTPVSGGVGSVGGGTPIFIYCCPDQSPQKLRMVYSTSKPSVIDQIKSNGISNLSNKKIEIFDGKDMTDEFLKSELSSSSTSSSSSGPNKWKQQASVGGGEVKSTNAAKIDKPHPVYSLLSDGSTAEKKKKIVMPPSGAW